MIVTNLNAQDETVNSLFADYSGSCPGASVLVCRDGKIIFNSSFGFANLEDKTKTDSKTNFRLASVTKQFTAAAVLILVQKGLVKLDAKLTDIFEDFPDYGRKITIKNLLSHTSGLIDYEDLIPDTATIQVKDADVLKIIYEQKSTYFEPGTQFKYSNTGYAMLAKLVERLSGKSFAQFLKENIFAPLEMTSTVAREEGISEVENRAFGYSRTDSGWVRKDQSITSAVLGDGGIYSNVEDLYKWEQSLYEHIILNEESLNNSSTRFLLNNGEKIDYGYGWHLKTYNGNEIVYHGGSTQGFRNVIYRVLAQKFAVIILTNRNEGEPEKIADTIFDLYRKE
jgi:CubicO group peptidase (beta-lactamase class C family)